MDEVSIDEDGHMHYLRRHNGDQTHQGRHARIAMGDWKTLYANYSKIDKRFVKLATFLKKSGAG